MRYFLLICLLGMVALSMASEVSAQWSCPPSDGVQFEDKLNAGQYFPFSVGNKWDYVTKVSAFQTAFRHTVVSDTLIGDTEFSKFQEIMFATGTSSVLANDTSYLYKAIKEDSLMDWTPSSGITFSGDILASIFNTTYYYEPSFNDSIRVGGCYKGILSVKEDESEISLELPAIKSFSSAFESKVFGHGIGPIAFAAEGGVITNLIYTKLDSIEIGTPIEDAFLVGIDDEISRANALEVNVFPNPITSNAQIHLLLTGDGPLSVRVYDILGREISVLVNKTNFSAGKAIVKWDASMHTPGPYLIVSKLWHEKHSMLVIKN